MSHRRLSVLRKNSLSPFRLRVHVAVSVTGLETDAQNAVLEIQLSGNQSTGLHKLGRRQLAWMATGAHKEREGLIRLSAASSFASFARVSSDDRVHLGRGMAGTTASFVIVSRHDIPIYEAEIGSSAIRVYPLIFSPNVRFL